MTPPSLPWIAAGAAALAGLYYLTSEGVIMLTANPALPPFPGAAQFTRAENAAYIRAVFGAFGVPKVGQDAAIANAIAESNLDNLAVGDSGNSVGLFQINAMGGTRRFDGDRRDPVYNSLWILRNEVTKPAGARYLGAVAAGDTVAAARYFGLDIERPADRIVGGSTWHRRGWLGAQVAAGRLPDNGEAHRWLEGEIRSGRIVLSK